jgi:protein-tyrosine phosphatase
MNIQKARTFAGRVKRRTRDLVWEIYGKRFRAAELSGPPQSVLFVCKGNICRSPFAGRLAQKIFDGLSGCKVVVDSAGLEVKAPCPSPENAIAAAAGFGVDLQDHRSKGFQASMYADFDMIVAMEVSQYQVLAKKRTAKRAQLFMLPFFDNPDMRPGGYERYNVADPYGKGLEEFNRCFQRIERCLGGMVKAISAVVSR